MISETEQVLSVMQEKFCEKLEKNAKNTPVFDDKNTGFSDFTEKHVVSAIASCEAKWQSDRLSGVYFYRFAILCE